MIVIGELINGMYKDVSRAVSNREVDVIQHLAEEQVKAGANILDINVGPYSSNPADDMKWLVDNVQKVVTVPVCLDSTRIDVISQAAKIAANRVIINSTSADDDKMSAVFELAKSCNAQVIGLAMDRSGIPNSKDARLELAAKIIAKAMEYGIGPEDIYLDPIAMPINVAQSQGREVIESIREFGMLCDPAPNTVIGLSNVSQGAGRNRGLIERTFLTMAIAGGLTAAIMDPLDEELMNAMITAELILNKNVYCDSFLDAYRKK